MAINNKKRNTLIIRNARLIFLNFTGKETQFTPKGTRTFSVIIDNYDEAQRLIADGWNLKILRPRDEDDEPRYHLPVAVRYDILPPRIVMRRDGKPDVELNEDTVSCLDYAEIANAHVNINPRTWEAMGRSGVKAYLKSMVVDIEEDELMAMLEDEEDGEEDF